MKKPFAAFIAAAAMAASFAVGTFADDAITEIAALLCRNYTVILDGETQTFKDANGAVVYPLNYNGTTYLPIRALSGAFGADVEWDGATNTITLTTKINAPENSGMTYARMKELNGIAVYWAPTGNKLHSSPHCSSFKDGIAYAGTYDQASSVRTGGWCGICGGFEETNPYAADYFLEQCFTYEDYLRDHPAEANG